MSVNELKLLDQILADEKNEREAQLPDDQAFELFAGRHILKDLELSDEEVLDGVVDGTDDGGIDLVHIFLNNILLTEDHEIFDAGVPASKLPKEAKLDAWFLQVKTEKSFREIVVQKAQTTLEHLLSLDIPESELRKLYNENLIQKAMLYRKALTKLASRHPKTAFHFGYASRGDTAKIASKVLLRGTQLEKRLSETVPGSNAEVTFYGAGELWRLANTIKSYTLPLTWKESINDEKEHIALVTLDRYLAFIADEEGALRRHIFDWNVRDYQGNIEVNKGIQASLNDAASPNFWWLNNGVTVVCSKASMMGKTYQLEDVQVVNGLQTSFTIFNTLKDLPEDDPRLKREVLVRILVTEDKSIRDKVINATNKQTTVAAASLRATDEIQRKIESFFSSKGWYYDRRKNYYKNIGKKPDRIVGIPYLAQAIMAVGLGEPNIARGRPSSLLKREDDYKRVFPQKLDLDVYLWIFILCKDVDRYLSDPKSGATSLERINLRFHVAFIVGCRLLERVPQKPFEFQSLARKNITVDGKSIKQAHAELREWIEELNGGPVENYDKMAKGSELVEMINSKIKKA